jgi:hypothetical protein
MSPVRKDTLEKHSGTFEISPILIRTILPQESRVVNSLQKGFYWLQPPAITSKLFQTPERGPVDGEGST